jgi:hypothetical protein
MNENRNASNLLTIDFDKIEASKYSKITKEVVKHFNLEENKEIVRGLDVVFHEFKLSKAIISLEWDNWSGYTVTAINVEAEPLARDIAAFINDKY